MRIQCLLLSILTIWGFSKLSKQIFPNFPLAGFVGSWCLAFSPLFYYYAINPLPDNFSLCASIWSLYFLLCFTKKKKNTFWCAHIILLSLSALSKLPFITFFSASLVVVFSVRRDSKNLVALLIPMLWLLLPTMWYLYVIPQWHNDGLKGGLFATKTPFNTLTDIFTHHLISTLPELITNYASLLALLVGIYICIKALRRKIIPLHKKALLAALISTLMYVFYELGMIGKEHDYYLFPLLPFILLTVVGGYRFLLQISNPDKWRLALYILAITGLVISPLTAWLRVQSRWNLDEPGLNPDYYRYRDKLRAAVPKNALVITGPDASQFINLYYLDRKGWTFTQPPLDKDFVNDKRLRGATFLITDSINATYVLPTNITLRRFGSLVAVPLPTR